MSNDNKWKGAPGGLLANLRTYRFVKKPQMSQTPKSQTLMAGPSSSASLPSFGSGSSFANGTSAAYNGNPPTSRRLHTCFWHLCACVSQTVSRVSSRIPSLGITRSASATPFFSFSKLTSLILIVCGWKSIVISSSPLLWLIFPW